MLVSACSVPPHVKQLESTQSLSSCSIVLTSLGSQVLLELSATGANPGDKDVFSLFGCGCC